VTWELFIGVILFPDETHPRNVSLVKKLVKVLDDQSFILCSEIQDSQTSLSFWPGDYLPGSFCIYSVTPPKLRYKDKK